MHDNVITVSLALTIGIHSLSQMFFRFSLWKVFMHSEYRSSQADANLATIVSFMLSKMKIIQLAFCMCYKNESQHPLLGKRTLLKSL